MPRRTAQPNLPAPAPQRNDIVVYESGSDVRLEVRTDGETVWLSQAQMCKLFGRDRSVITKHIRNMFKEGELDEKLVCAKFAHTIPHGAMPGRTQLSELTLYNLDVVISVGYRVKSVQGVRFRQWATRVLRSRIRKANRPAFGESVRLASSVRSRLRRSTGWSSRRFVPARSFSLSCRAALPREKTDARPTRRAVTRGAVGLAKSRVQQLSAPPPDPPRRKIGFTQNRR